MSDPAIRVESLTKRYGLFVAVEDVSFQVPRGCIFGLIGPNGAGKTTTLNVLATLLAPDGGRVEIAGFDPVSDPVEVRRRIGYVPDTVGVYEDLLVDEYLDFFASAYEVPAADRPALIDGLLELVGLEVKREAPVDTLSRGMKQRLSLARALVHDPEILVLDEPASGLDPHARIELRRILEDLRELGKTIVISSHILTELEQICTQVAILEAGRLLAAGTPQEIGERFQAGIRVRVRLAGGEVRDYVVADEEEQRALLWRLVASEGLPVVEFTSERGLEDLFMKVTRGEVR